MPLATKPKFVYPKEQWYLRLIPGTMIKSTGDSQVLFLGQSESITAENSGFCYQNCSDPKWKESQLPLGKSSPHTQFPSLP